MRPVRLTAIALIGAAACVPGVPRVDGGPAAPPAPARPWRPPPLARVSDSLGSLPAAPAAPAAPGAELGPRPEALGLADVVALALRNNPATRASWAQARAAADAFGVARASYLPAVSGVVTGSRSQQPAAATSSSSSSSSSTAAAGPRTSYVPSVSLSYLLFDVGGRSGTVDNARETAFALAFTHNQVLQATVLQVEQAYFGYAGARALRDAQRESVREARASYDAARM
ncbi:MAG TPA: TolC family protein, partial [Gemmatimonadaceae bacterium]|nr:TolC family protein [Gemmatimonadaceae bacterium]